MYANGGNLRTEEPFGDEEGDNDIDDKEESYTNRGRTRISGLAHVGWKTRRLVSLWRIATSTAIPTAMILATVFFVIVDGQ